MGTVSIHESRRLEAVRLQQQQARILREAALEADLPATTSATLPGDTRKLRGIPAIGRGVSGCIPDTQPEQATIEKLMRETPDGPRRSGDHGTVDRWIT